MFECTCCQPARSFSYKKTLYKHQRKYDAANYVDPRERDAKERRDAYYADPKKCLTCETMISYEDASSGTKDKFCSRSCAAKLNGALFPRRKSTKEKRDDCLLCETPLKKNAGRFCSVECNHEHRFLNLGYPRFLAGEITSRRSLKRYLVNDRGWRCECCRNTEWLGEEIPLELDHIDGDASNNLPVNLRLLCPNCHAKTPTAKGRNRGSGRKARGIPRN